MAQSPLSIIKGDYWSYAFTCCLEQKQMNKRFAWVKPAALSDGSINHENIQILDMFLAHMIHSGDQKRPDKEVFSLILHI